MAERIEFGSYEFSLTELQLYKHGIRLKLQEQPSRVLAILLANAGQVVSRERLQQELWPDASFGEFEAGLNTALSKLRAVLGDSAANPVYIERVPRQGYRFVAPLRTSAEPAATAAESADTQAAQPRSRVMVGAALLVALCGIVAAIAWSRGEAGKAPPVPVRFSIHLPADQELALRRTPGRVVSLSDDGTTLGYLATTGATTQVYVRKWSEPEFRVVSGTQGATDFVLSPDGGEVLFLMQAGWMKVDVAGTNLRAVGEPGRRGEAGAIWGEQGEIYAPATMTADETDTATNYYAVYRMTTGRRGTRLTPKPDAKGPTYFPEQLLPDGRHILLGANSGPTSRWLVAMQRGGSQLTRLVEPAMGGFYLNSGHLVYFWRDTLFAAPFDLAAMKAAGPGLAVVNRVAVNQWLGAQAALSSTGTLAYVPKPFNYRNLVWLDRSGNETALELPPGQYVFLSLSPSGSRILVHREDGDQAGIWMHDQKPGGKWTRLVAGSWSSTSAAWSPDEKSVVFTAALQGEQFENLYQMRLDPPGGPERIAPSPFGQFVQSWTEAAGLIYTESDKPVTRIDLHRLRWRNGVPRSDPLVTTAEHDSHASVSPDGRWLAYTSSVDDQSFVYVRPLEGSAEPALKVTPDGGFCALWSPAGNEIFYRREAAMWSLPVREGKPVGAAKRLFATNSGCRIWNREFGVSSDGNRFMLTKPVPDADDRKQIRVVLNWTAELEQLVPSRR